MVPIIWSIASAAAADTEVGGALDAVAGVVHPPNAPWSGVAGLREAEGDLLIRTGAVSIEADLDTSLVVDFPLPVVFAVVPEVLAVRGGAGKVWLDGGIEPTPWRLERVDGWDNTLVTWSAEDRHYLPGSLLGGQVGFGERTRGVSVVAGLDLGDGLDLMADPGPALTRAPIIAGVYACAGERDVTVSGGVFVYPDSPAVAAQVAATFDLDTVRLQAQAEGGWNAPAGGHVEVDAMPRSVVTPVARLEYFAGQPGGALGVAVKPARFFTAKAELGYADGDPQAWLEVALFRPWPPEARRAASGSGAKRKG